MSYKIFYENIGGIELINYIQNVDNQKALRGYRTFYIIKSKHEAELKMRDIKAEAEAKKIQKEKEAGFVLHGEARQGGRRPPGTGDHLINESIDH